MKVPCARSRVLSALGVEPKQPRPEIKEKEAAVFDPSNAHATLCKILDLDVKGARGSLLTPKMASFLAQPGVCEIWIGFLSRIPDSDLKRLPSPDFSSASWSRRAYVPTSEEEDTATKRSYKVMQNFCSSTTPDRLLYTLLADKMATLILGLFSVFLPSSQGNFYHAGKVLIQIVTTLPKASLSVLLKEGQQLLLHAFLHLHEPLVVDVLIQLLRSHPDAAVTSLQVQVFSLLRSSGVHGFLVGLVCDHGAPEDICSSVCAMLRAWPNFGGFPELLL